MEGNGKGAFEQESIPSPGANTFQRSALRDFYTVEACGLQTPSGVGSKLNLLHPEALSFFPLKLPLLMPDTASFGDFRLSPCSSVSRY